MVANVKNEGIGDHGEVQSGARVHILLMKTKRQGFINVKRCQTCVNSVHIFSFINGLDGLHPVSPLSHPNSLASSSMAHAPFHLAHRAGRPSRGPAEGVLLAARSGQQPIQFGTEGRSDIAHIRQKQYTHVTDSDLGSRTCTFRHRPTTLTGNNRKRKSITLSGTCLPCADQRSKFKKNQVQSCCWLQILALRTSPNPSKAAFKLQTRRTS